MATCKCSIFRILEFTGLASLCVAFGSICSCAKQETQEPVKHEEVLIQVGDSILTRDMVTRLIPNGLSPTDSIRMFDAIVEAWVERNMLVNLAGSQLPDIEKIERLVEQYREQLLANEYRKLMADDNVAGITSSEIMEYYNSHADLFVLERPLVKGLYLKIDSKAPQINEVRSWVRAAQSADIDNLENDGLRGAMEYDYFADTWVDWQVIADHIPYRFGDADKFVKDNYYFEWEDNGTIYILRITDRLLSGEKMPLAFAEADIRERLMESKRGSYDRMLLNSIFTKGLKSNAIKRGSYTPLKYR
ncbi:MAG: peptidylprolyl isomerase [Prevotella sp.]|nr:peptidylprolyl isomerase [Prevotella sp.]MCM1074429.1 peptidylprolyl isomerase [Ruminococcus sp.]